MSGKGSKRRKEDTAAVEANWPFPDRKRKPEPEPQEPEEDAQ